MLEQPELTPASLTSLRPRVLPLLLALSIVSLFVAVKADCPPRHPLLIFLHNPKLTITAVARQ